MIAGVILAGGRSRRLPGDPKALRSLGRVRLVDHVAARFRPQVARLLINANERPEAYAGLGCPLIGDSLAGHQGPLAGLLAAMEWLDDHDPAVDWLASVPVDGPFLPEDLVVRLAAAAFPVNSPAIAMRAGRAHPVFALWPLGVMMELKRFLTERSGRRLLDFTDMIEAVPVAFECGEIDPFFNLNTPDDLRLAEALLTSDGSFSHR